MIDTNEAIKKSIPVQFITGGKRTGKLVQSLQLLNRLVTWELILKMEYKLLNIIYLNMPLRKQDMTKKKVLSVNQAIIKLI